MGKAQITTEWPATASKNTFKMETHWRISNFGAKGAKYNSAPNFLVLQFLIYIDKDISLYSKNIFL